jgi:hypothetical protein
MGGKAKDELAEFEKTLSATTIRDTSADAKKSAARKAADKLEIDLSDEDPANIPMNDEDDMDKLFPLDSMDDPFNNNDKK